MASSSAGKSAWDVKEMFVQLPGWAWPFVALCLFIPVAALGGALPVGLGIAGAMGCAAVAKDAQRRKSTRIALCLAITVGAWVGFIALQWAVAQMR
jgi:hypothetical protein